MLVTALAVLFSGWPAQSDALTPPGTVIANTAFAQFDTQAGVRRAAASNPVEVTVVAVKTPSTTEFTRLLPGGATTAPLTASQCLSGTQFIDQRAPHGTDGNPLSLTAPYPFASTGVYSRSETVFVRVTDIDQNRDPATAEAIEVSVTNAASGDEESLRLTETEPASGVFTGYIPLASAPAAALNCSLEVNQNTEIRVAYTDSSDALDSSEARASIDPVNVVFNATTGELVDGVSVTLIDVATGQPASVLGYDGVGEYPATVESGASATDASGIRYEFPNGGYNFPRVAPGSYRLLIEPPSEYLAPSIRSIAELSALPGAPYILGEASFGRAVTLSGLERVAVDVPIDPFSGGLFLTKGTMTRIASPGDFVRYQLRIENTSELTPAENVVIDDTPSPGLVFVAGSVTINGESAPDALSRDGGFSIALGRIDPGQSVTLSYVVEVTGGVRGETAVNTARARADRGIGSNSAEAAIELVEELFRSTTTLIGRIVEADCKDSSFAEDAGIEGVRVYLEDGRYVVTDAAGRYHFEGVRPGMHVVQLDRESVPDWYDLASCDGRLRDAGNPASQFVDARGGALQRADFYVRRKLAPEGRVNLNLSNSAGDTENAVRYAIDLDGIGNIEIANLTVSVILPQGVQFTAGSTRLDSGQLVEPTVAGPTAIFRLGERNHQWNDVLRFDATVRADATGELTTRAIATFDTPAQRANKTTPASVSMLREAATSESADYELRLNFHSLSAEFSASDKAELDRLIEIWQGLRNIRLQVTGHSDSVPISARNRHLFADNYALSAARAEAVAQYLSLALDIRAGDVQTVGQGPDSPVADNATPEGKRLNRRVELVMSGERPGKRAFMKASQAASGVQIASARGRTPGPENAAGDTDSAPASMDSILRAQNVELPSPDTLSPGIDWILPLDELRPAVPSIRVALKHPPGSTIELLRNDEPVSPLSYEGVAIGERSGVALSSWRAVNLDDGANVFRARITNADSGKVSELTRSVHYAGGPIRGELVATESRLNADGKRRPIIAIRLFDGDGEIARTGSVGGFRVDAPYRSWWEVGAAKENALLTIGDREPVYRVEPDGIARIELEPTTEAGEVVVRLAFNNQREQEIRAWLKPSARDWILVGLAEGTVGYNTVSDNIEAASRAGVDEEFYQDGRVAFFAKGQIRGEYLLTLAYDTRGYAADPLNFDGVVDPDAYYTIYGDGTESRVEAPSQRKLYVKLERNQFVGLFGDFDTALSVTELARYERRYNGVQLAFSGQRFDYSAFAADATQGFKRDELRGNGTSGLYRLSIAPIITNSESVTLEVRDRFDTSRVLTSNTLNRFVDYDIDYLRGTLTFKRPILSRDADFNPQFIVAQYETRAAGGENRHAGGRAAVHTLDKSLEFGTTYISEGQQNGNGRIAGADVRWQVGDATEIKAEYADSTSQDSLEERRGHGYRLGVEHRTGRLDVEAYHARVDTGFGLGQQSVSELGIEKTALNGRVSITEQTFAEAELVRQENLDTGLQRRIANASINTTRGDFAANLGITYARDLTIAGETRETNLLTSSLSQGFYDKRFVARLSSEFPLNGQDEVIDYPSRMLSGLDWNINASTTAFIEHEVADGSSIDTQMTRLGLRASPWQRARFDSSLGQQTTEFGPRLFANIGAVQGWQINERWSVDFGIDQSETLSGPASIVFDTDRELASGSLTEDFVTSFVGGVYQAGDWTANTRLEFRNADLGDSTTIIAGAYREPSVGHGLSAGLELFDADFVAGGLNRTANLRFGWANRMANRRWSFLDRADLILESSGIAQGAEESWRLVNNFNANKRINAGSELSLQYGMKYVRADFDGASYSGFTDLIGLEYRRGVKPRWDVGVHASVYHSWRADVVDYGLGAEAGYNVADNTWVSVGYNFAGYLDDDFSGGKYTAQGPYIGVSVKADEHTLKKIAGLLRGQRGR